MPILHSCFQNPRFQGLTYSEVNLDNFEGLRKEVVMETGHRTVPVVFDMRGDAPVFVGVQTTFWNTSRVSRTA